jgi:hypothetical protein
MLVRAPPPGRFIISRQLQLARERYLAHETASLSP